MLVGLETTTLSAALDAARGVNDRLRSFPINASAIVLGRCLADTLNSLIGVVVLAGCGLAIGWRPDTSPGGAGAGDEPAQAWVTTILGVTATMQDTREALTPPWAQ